MRTPGLLGIFLAPTPVDSDGEVRCEKASSY